MAPHAEAMTMINHMLERDPNTAEALKTMVNPFSGISSGHWLCLNILEASKAHEH